MSQKVTPFMGGLGRDVTSKFEITDDASVTVGDGTNGGNVAVGDNGIISVGAESDLQLFHDGTHTYIDEINPTGYLFIRGANIQLLNPSNELYLEGNTNGSVDLYHDNIKKLATTSTGVDVTGDVQGDGLIIDGTFDLGTL